MINNNIQNQVGIQINKATPFKKVVTFELRTNDGAPLAFTGTIIVCGNEVITLTATSPKIQNYITQASIVTLLTQAQSDAAFTENFVNSSPQCELADP